MKTLKFLSKLYKFLTLVGIFIGFVCSIVVCLMLIDMAGMIFWYGGVMVVLYLIQLRYNYLKKQHKRIRKSYRVGEKLTITKKRLTLSPPFLKSVPVECIVTEDYKIVPVSSLC